MTVGWIVAEQLPDAFGKHSLHCAAKSIRFKSHLYYPTELLQRSG